MGMNMFDDFVFPSTIQGMRQSGMIFESDDCRGRKMRSRSHVKEDADEEDDVKIPDDIYDDDDEDDDDVYEGTIAEHFEADAKMRAMQAVLDWISDDDHSYDSLAASILAYSDIDLDNDNEAMDPVDGERMDAIWKYVPGALVKAGCNDMDAIQAIVDGPSADADKAAPAVAEECDSALADNVMEDADIAAEYAFGFDAVLESCKRDPKRRAVVEKERDKQKARAVEECGYSEDAGSDLYEAAGRDIHRTVKNGKIMLVNVHRKGAGNRGLKGFMSRAERINAGRRLKKLNKLGSIKRKQRRTKMKARKMIANYGTHKNQRF